MKKFTLSVLALAAALFFTSCASSIPVKVQRPAELDLGGANSISVLPFQTSSTGDDGTISVLGLFTIKFTSNQPDPKQQTVDYLTNSITNALLDSGFMEVVGSKRVQTALDNGTQVPCDCYLTGYLQKYEEGINSDYDDDDECYYYSRYVNTTVVYQVINANTNRVVAVKSKDISKSTMRYKNRSEVDDPVEMVKSDLDYLTKTIMKELQPYEETKYLSLLDDKEKDEDMKAAKQLAKDGFLEMAQEKYEEIYASKGYYQAGYDAAILFEAQGNLDAAEELMYKVYIASGEKKAYSALNDIKNEKAYAAKLQNQLNQKSGN